MQVNIIPRHFIYLLYLYPWLDLGLFLSDLCDLFFIFIFIFTETSYFAHFLKYVLFFLTDSMDEECKNFQIAKVQPQGLT